MHKPLAHHPEAQLLGSMGAMGGTESIPQPPLTHRTMNLHLVQINSNIRERTRMVANHLHGLAQGFLENVPIVPRSPFEVAMKS